METGKIRVLTDDGVDGGMLSGASGDLDLAARWLNDDTLVFIRYAHDPSASADAPLSERFLPPALYTVDLVGETKEWMPTPSFNFVSAYALALDNPRRRAAVNLDLRDTGPDQGIWQIPFDEGEAEPLYSVPSMVNVPQWLEYSADGRYLMTFEREPRQSGMTMRIVSTETGEIMDIDPRFPTTDEAQDAPYIMGAGWSPVGSGLVYVVRDPFDDSRSGLYLTDAPGKAGTLILQGRYYGTTCCQRMPIQWAANDLILIGRGSDPGVLLVQVGMPG